MPVDTSPDSKCPICLDRFDNIAYLDNCWHKFCFRCVQNRSKTKAECPLCKLPFVSIFHTIRADNDYREYKVTPSEEAASSSLQGSTTTFAQNPWNLHMCDLYDGYNYPTPSRDEGSGSNSTVLADILGSKHSSSVSGVGQSPWDDETPGPSSSTLEEYGATTASLQELLESSNKDSAWKRIMLQAQLQAGVDASDSDSSIEHNDITGYVNLYAERTPELTELPSADPEESIGKKRKYVKKEQSIQRPSKKRKTRRLQASPQNSDSSHGHGPCRKRHSEHQLRKRCSRSRDGSKNQSKRSRRSRPHGTSLSQKHQRGSGSSENAATRDSNRSRAHHKGHGQRRSSSQDSDNHYRRGCYCSGYKCDYPSNSQKTARDSPSCRSRSRSSSRSRSPSRETYRTSEKPGGKRNCKTRHLENTEKGSTTMQAKYSFERIVSSDCYKYKGSLSDNQESSEAEPKQKKKRMGSPSVESL